MNKKQFVKAVAAESGETMANTARLLDAMMTVISVCMENDERIVLPGFGTFHTQVRSARTMRNFQTGTPLKVEARKIVRFRAGSKLREQVSKRLKVAKTKCSEKKVKKVKVHP